MNKEDIILKLSMCSPTQIEEAKYKASAVIAPLFHKDGEWHILLTLRSANLPSHANQISFPGGRIDAGESAHDAALREMKEEMGIEPEHVEIIGCLDDMKTITGYKIRPFVAIIPHPYEYKVSHDEVAEVIELPFRAFTDEGCCKAEAPAMFEGKPYPVYSYRIGKHIVWGATAKMIKQLVDILADK